MSDDMRWYSSRFSRATLAELAASVERVYTHVELDLLLRRVDAVGADEDEWGNRGNKLQRAIRLVDALEARDPEEGSAVLTLLCELLEERLRDHVLNIVTGEPEASLRRLIDGLRADGFEFVGGRIIPTTPGPAAMAPEISLVEHELTQRNLNVAREHYRQAVASFLDSRREASNGQLRSCLESFLIEVDEQSTGRQAGDPRGAVEHLRNANRIDADEARLLQGLVGVSKARGAHHGLTDQAEATFRLHVTTAVIRYLLARIPQE